MQAVRAWCTCCFPTRKPKVTRNPVKREKDSLLSMYGIDELSEAEDDNDGNTPMSPEQVHALLERQIALTQELEGDAAEMSQTQKRSSQDKLQRCQSREGAASSPAKSERS